MKQKMKYEEIYQQYMYSYPHKTAYRPLEGISLEQYYKILKEQKNSLYFHIPFCESKCGYCNLFSVTGKLESYISSYLDACERQAEQYNMAEIEFSDLTIGGGTPLLLSENQLERLFLIANTYFGWKSSNDIEKMPIIIETAPNQTTEEKICILKENNVSRVSIGVQSFCQEELKNLSRHHTVKQSRQALTLLKNAKFPCLNLDLIYGIKGQTLASLKKSLEEAIYYEPNEIFIYPLYIKPGTILDLKQEKASENRYEFYGFISEFLKKNGYYQSSMRRFVSLNASLESLSIGEKVHKMQAQENQIRSCGFENTISIGCGGRSYIGNLHFCTPYSVKQDACKKILNSYIEKEDYRKITYGYLLSEEEIRRRYVIKNLLVVEGISLEEYKKRFHSDFMEDYKVLQPFFEEGYILNEDERVVLSKEGMALSDYIGPSLISEEVKQRMCQWSDNYGY